ncbi:MAG TPA: S-layer homology domain-containing protein, partial [Egibacteraceae bacterium]|nr:S-layer homology domain-containing protein [Egibacteraceae bacterium]
HRGWMQSEGHRRNMLNRYHDAVGIGIICDADGTMWATMNMGRFTGSTRPAYDNHVPADPIVHNNDGGTTCRDFNRSAASAPLPVPLPPLKPGEFRDVNGGPHAPAIKALALRDITNGCTAELFCPDRQITRAQMASLIARARKLPATGGSYFTDIAGSPHAGAINALAAAGITGGCGPDRFCPDAPVSRAQMASFLQRAWKLRSLSLSLSLGDRFSDIASSVHRTAINTIASAGITRGCGDGRYCPNQPVKRAEMASFLARALGLV